VRTVRCGVLGTSEFAQTKFIPGMKHCRSGEGTAIASRDLCAAKAAADRLGIAKAYGSYEELLGAADVGSDSERYVGAYSARGLSGQHGSD
jgi:xylose dehydrogenase (NAD/NADP)